jgi:hypothetical protein
MSLSTSCAVPDHTTALAKGIPPSDRPPAEQAPVLNSNRAVLQLNENEICIPPSTYVSGTR